MGTGNSLALNARKRNEEPMSTVLHRPGSLEAYFTGQTAVQDIRWEISQSNLNLVATKEALEKQGVRMQEELQEGFGQVSDGLEGIQNTLVQGVVVLHTDLVAIKGSVRDLSAKFEWGFARLEAGLGDVRDSLQDLLRLAKTPEQTWAYEQYELARDAYRRALLPEALEHINRAIKGDQSHTGHRLEHRFHRFLGMIYRSGDLADLVRAKGAYLDAARYAGTDHPADAALALYAAARLSYNACEIEEAERLLRQALTFDEFHEGRYWLAKVLLHQHKVQEGIANLVVAVSSLLKNC
jgi:tetratricopeptide (TPR) repeat protein